MSVAAEFLAKVQAAYGTGKTTEHSFRSAIEFLFRSLDKDVTPINEPRREKCGAPDFIVQRGDIAIGHIEAKDLDVDLRAMKGVNKEQKERYLKALPNLIYTNCLDFDFYRDGELVSSVSIGDFLMGIQPKPDQFEALEHLICDFLAQRPQTITSTRTLARMMAGKAVLIKDVLANALKEDGDLATELTGQYAAFKKHLIHDITPEDFADIYAETIAYGMFAARLHDETVDSFSRQEALELLPKSNPFLRNLFSYIAGPNLDDRIKWIIDDLADVFRACDLHGLMEDFGKLTGRNDPFLHFYEDFLKEYNPAKRKSRGVWYTPEPVVNFIVRAVDDVLQKEFGLAEGLADTSKVTIDWETGEKDKKGKPVTIKKEVHKVQILDPATGTGTFLAEVIKQVAPRIKGVAEGMWSSYVEKDLIPRLHGFELLMASYAMCHMKLDMILTDLGYKPAKNPPRLSVFLTNSLEEGEAANQTLPFAQWLSNEVKEANTIKRDMPIMCVIGNPPYSGHSVNRGSWISGLMDVYKQSPELKRPAQAKWLSDDYVKFVRFAEHMIEKNGEGVLGFITNHGYLDNPTFVDMRRHLMETFDSIFIIDLHGSVKKKETTPEGGMDKNVFDIMQGVAIIIAAKKHGSDAEDCRVFHQDVWGSRLEKYNWLWSEGVDSNGFVDITPKDYPWRFAPYNDELFGDYKKGFSVTDLFNQNGRVAPGIVTTQDQFAVSWSKDDVVEKVDNFLQTSSEEEARRLFKLCTQAQWNYERAKKSLSTGEWKEKISPIMYRPFDLRFTVYDSNVSVHLRDRVMHHMRANRNFALSFNRTVEQKRPYTDVFVFDGLMQHHSLSLKEVNYLTPLYLYPSEGDLDQTRRVNFDPKLYKQLKKLAKHPEHGEPDEVAVFDYIYGVLHCPAYRETFAEFLKSDFPRIPWPASPGEFWSVAGKGGQLRRLHLMEEEAIGEAPYPFKGEGDNVVDKPRFDGEKVFINAHQYFEGVPETSWTFFIGGYQPAQKWLKDRKGRALSFDDVRHYQKIVKILAETDRIMKTITMTLPGEKGSSPK